MPALLDYEPKHRLNTFDNERASNADVLNIRARLMPDEDLKCSAKHCAKHVLRCGASDENGGPLRCVLIVGHRGYKHRNAMSREF